MAGMAAGDPEALFGFVDEFGPRLAGVVGQQLRSYGRRDVAGDPDQLAFLVHSAALAVFDRAGGWRADGARPWTWAARAIRHEVDRYLGHPSVAYDPVRHDAATAAAATSTVGVPAAGGSLRPRHGHRDRADLAGPGAVVELDGLGPELGLDAGVDDFDDLADRDPVVGLLREAIAEVASPRDRRIHVQMGIQKRSGDTSPAVTVAAELGLTAANIRQIDHRVGVRLRELVRREERYAALRDLAWCAAPAARRGAASRPPVSARVR
jgi:hypothetical protein